MNKKTGIFVIIIAILTLGIGYAAITAVALTVNGSGTINADQENFNVHYTGNVTVTKSNDSITTTQSHDSEQSGTFTITGMKQQGDSVTFTYSIINESVGLKANLATPTITTNSNSAYFNISTATTDTVLTAEGGTTTQTVTVTAAKTPVTQNEQATFEIQLEASPDNS